MTLPIDAKIKIYITTSVRTMIEITEKMDYNNLNVLYYRLLIVDLHTKCTK